MCFLFIHWRLWRGIEGCGYHRGTKAIRSPRHAYPDTFLIGTSGRGLRTKPEQNRSATTLSIIILAPVTIVHTVGYDRVSYCFQTLYDEKVRDLYIGRAAITRHFQSVFDEGRYYVLDLNVNSPFCKSWCETEQSFVSMQLYNRRPYSLSLWVLKRLWGRR